MTTEGLDKLRTELKEHEERRPKVLLQIKEAREKGDLSENAEYHAAREDLSMLENQIRILKDKIGRSVRSNPARIKAYVEHVIASLPESFPLPPARSGERRSSSCVCSTSCRNCLS